MAKYKQPDKPSFREKNDFSEHIDFWRVITQFVDQYEELSKEIEKLKTDVAWLMNKAVDK